MNHKEVIKKANEIQKPAGRWTVKEIWPIIIPLAIITILLIVAT